tara:strand:+ start:345 stop:689 length:345 start_codon:yes stop_codon:yes gene_type:complete
MRLYTDNKGVWAGTQSDAKKLDGSFELAEVPTDKATLLTFLNEYQVGQADVISAQMDMVSNTVDDAARKAQVTTTPSNVWEVQDAIRLCDRKHLGHALAAIISRLHDELEEQEL